MLEILAILSLAAAVVLLIWLSIVDLRIRLLPNTLVLAFLVCGIVFHLCTLFGFLSPPELLLGAAVGAGILYAIRAVAMRFYGEDALGLGDVKLLGAGGVWLGPYFILIALTLGALLGIAHGLGITLYQWAAKGVKPNLHTLSVPAGPGFALGIALAGLLKFAGLEM